MAGVYYTDDLIVEPFHFVDGAVMAPVGPGLGIEVDRAKIDRYRV
jgi:muconate cycloisomerase